MTEALQFSQLFDDTCAAPLGSQKFLIFATYNFIWLVVLRSSRVCKLSNRILKLSLKSHNMTLNISLPSRNDSTKQVGFISHYCPCVVCYCAAVSQSSFALSGLITLMCDESGEGHSLQHVVLVVEFFFFFFFPKVRSHCLIIIKSCQSFTTSAQQKYAMRICCSHPNQNFTGNNKHLIWTEFLTSSIY